MDLLTFIENLGLAVVSGDERSKLSDLTDDSRRVTAGSLFVARGVAGQDGERWRGFVADAVKRGAAAIVAPDQVEVPPGVSLVVPSGDTPGVIDQALAGRLAARFFGEPAKKLNLIGITGTNGKTTVATLTQYLLNAAGKVSGGKCGLLGTVAIDHGAPEGPQPAELTTPGAIDLHRHFAAMVTHGCDACAMEVSSHALDQGRVDGLEFDVAVFTNLTQDHLDYHGTMGNYAAAKAKLFGMLSTEGIAILNGDDSASRKMLPPKHGVLQTLVRPHASEKRIEQLQTDGVFVAKIAELRAEGCWVSFGLGGVLVEDDFVAEGPAFSTKLPVVGRHNVSNVLQAVGAAAALADFDLELLADALVETVAVPGRLELVRSTSRECPVVLVDYAHTPDALDNVMATLRPITEGKLIVVFGCGGDRDRAKRPLMAQAACGLADVAVLTSDNPRTEDPQQILDDAIVGVPANLRSKLRVEIGRAKAIESAILNANVNDTVLIAGKGHEDYQIIGTTKIHFDDREHAAAALQKWVAHNAEEKSGGEA